MDKHCIILQDTREQQPIQYAKKYTVHKTCLETGDYSIITTPGGDLKSKYTDEDLDYLLCIERKKSPSELASNTTTENFKRELQRMSVFRHKYLLMEFSFDDILRFPVGSSIPKKRWKSLRVKSPFIISCIANMSIQYNITPLFAGDSDNAAHLATSIMNTVYKRYLEI